jgi:hypothetical protein
LTEKLVRIARVSSPVGYPNLGLSGLAGLS